jgi:hypothetical protein
MAEFTCKDEPAVCLVCPYEDCILSEKDNTISRARLLRDTRNREVVRLYSKGLPRRVLAGKFRVCMRTVDRVLKKHGIKA